MFDRFTDRARKVMGLARQEAQRWNHDYIGTEHILLGLVREGAGVAASTLQNLDIDPKRICEEVERRVSRGKTMVTMGQLPFTPNAKRVLELSLEEASNLGHTYIGTEHVLLGLIREHEGIAAQVLRSLEVNVEQVRAEVLDLLGAEPGLEPAPGGGGRLTTIPLDLVPERLFAPDAVRAVERAIQSGGLHGAILTPAHLLLGTALGLLPPGRGPRVAAEFDATDVAACVEKHLATSCPPPDRPSTRVSLTPAATRVLGRAILEAGRAGRTQARIEELFLALLEDEDAEAATVVRSAGADPERLLRVLREPPPPGNSA